MRSRYVLGLSATVKRADGLESIVYAECGSVVFSVTTSQMAYQRGIRQEFIPHFLETAYRNEKNFTEVLNRISADSDRSFAIAENIADACRKGRGFWFFQDEKFRIIFYPKLLRHMVYDVLSWMGKCLLSIYHPAFQS